VHAWDMVCACVALRGTLLLPSGVDRRWQEQEAAPEVGAVVEPWGAIRLERERNGRVGALLGSL
jgi:hypothetical protein